MAANLFIVPHDFTSVGDSALEYAIFLARPMNTTIMVLHIASEKDNIQNIQGKLDKIVEKFKDKQGDVPIETKIEKGTIFNDISKIAEANDARLIVMGTHGAHGMQKVFGSYAMKVVTNSHIPFLVVQDGVKDRKLDSIVIPITTSKESLQIINIGIIVANNFNSTIHFIAEDFTDVLLLQKIKIRMSLVEKQMREYGVEAKYEYIKSKGSFAQTIINYAKTNQIDVIATSHYTDRIIPQLDRHTQQLITNKENIPCLVINAKLMEKLYF